MFRADQKGGRDKNKKVKKSKPAIHLQQRTQQREQRPEPGPWDGFTAFLLTPGLRLSHQATWRGPLLPWLSFNISPATLFPLSQRGIHWKGVLGKSLEKV